MNEDQQIERATAEGFLLLFNQQFGADYEIVEIGDTPDVRCQDPNGRALNLEITLTEDRQRDIQAALGRSDHRNAENSTHHRLRPRYKIMCWNKQSSELIRSFA
jgi:hypothetical protein